ncbi:DUF6381 family protein [Streptomyces sp. NPDC048411]|uniref:DUF6381 family protein n=1 Tax=Streptomyces sp. NPDC048411 TaxID=3157206 RepID=UPI00345369F3
MMSVAGESASRAQQMQDKVRELNERAEQTSDPKERRRLHDEVRRLLEPIQQGGRAAEDKRGRRTGSRRDEFPPR